MPKWIRIKDAMEITGHETPSQVTDFIRRWNRTPANASKIILKMHGKVDQETLKAAINAHIRRYTPGARTAAAVNDHTIRRHTAP